MKFNLFVTIMLFCFSTTSFVEGLWTHSCDPKSAWFSEKISSGISTKRRIYRTGVLIAISLAIHNFPEGIATFIAALDDPTLGITIAVAIAIHNIPEGIAVSMPIFFATGDRKKAFIYSFLSGVVEPLGAILVYFILMPFITPALMGFLLAGVAGVMVFISLDQLLPAAEEYGEHHLSIYGVVLGMSIMALSLILMM